MNSDLATKIAVMVSELGKLAHEYDAPPGDDAIDIIANVCSPEDASTAVTLALSVLVTSGLQNRSADGKRLPSALLNTVELCARALALMHAESSMRDVSPGEVLRTIATHMDRTGGLERLLDSIKRITGSEPIVVRVPRPDEGGGKPGAN